jgi:hypothetical protein
MEGSSFSSALPIIILTRPAGTDQDWQELDRGPGYFSIPEDHEVRVRIKSIDDQQLHELIQELQGLEQLRFLDLSENRNVTNSGLARLKALPQLTGLNLSSCTLNNSGLEHLQSLPNLTNLNVSFCNRLSDASLKTFESMRKLEYVDMQGCLSITKGGIARVRRRNLTIYRG